MTLDETLQEWSREAVDRWEAWSDDYREHSKYVMRLIDALKTCRLQRNLLSKEFGHIETMDAELLAILEGK